jgi:demethylmenaquinone methyltransferase/2-methoxy-6-polyprenyl-1,4-benzoquinol methylase
MSVDKTGSRVRAMFGQIAGRYDLLNHLLSLGIDHRWRHRTVRLAAPRPGKPILDVCAGTADLAIAYQRACRKLPLAQRPLVVAADFCRPMLARGLGKLLRTGAHGEVVLIEADTLRLPFRDDCFQMVCVAFGLRNLCDTLQGLCEMTRVCASGGKVVVLEFSTPRGGLLASAYRWYLDRLLPVIGQTLAHNRLGAYNYLAASVAEFPQGEALAALMRQAGLHDVAVHRFTFGIASLYIGTK